MFSLGNIEQYACILFLCGVITILFSFLDYYEFGKYGYRSMLIKAKNDSLCGLIFCGASGFMFTVVYIIKIF